MPNVLTRCHLSEDGTIMWCLNQNGRWVPIQHDNDKRNGRNLNEDTTISTTEYEE
ncbi:MAG: hypothetical protein HGB03_02235 [Candidatus Yonathbacteria bacterium]|nr:hypothetical protein [Candidatus Yonathbacteria bacterium]